jgi:hypothetical protein
MATAAQSCSLQSISASLGQFQGDGRPARAMHYRRAMLDFLFVAVTVGFFGVAWAYVRVCHRLAGAP